MYIYGKQCEIRQNNKWKGWNSQKWFNKVTTWALCWKRILCGIWHLRHMCVIFLPLCILHGWFHPFFAHEKIYDPKKSRYNLQNSNRSVLFRRTQFPFQHGGARFCLLFTVGDQASDIRGKGSPDQRKAWTSAESLTEGKVMYNPLLVHLSIRYKQCWCQVPRTWLTTVSCQPVHLIRGSAHLQLWRCTEFRKSIKGAK